MRSIPLLLLIFLGTSSIIGPAEPPMAIRATPVMLDPGDPARTKLGRLRFLGGWELDSARPDFGGISSLHVRKERFLAISDTGTIFRFTMHGDGRIVDTRFATLPAGPGTGEKKEDRDSESLAIDPASGKAWVGFERHNAIWRYNSALDRAEASAAPEAMKDWPWNGGPEAMARLADGRFIVICEEPKGPGDTHRALLFASDPTQPGSRPTSFLYRAPPGFWVTDAAELPGGRLLILHRDYSVERGVSAALAVIDPATIKEGAVIAGEPVARFAAPLTLDNMEALSVERAGRRTILWLASDDNFSPLQRTLLMKFELE
jgi:hypothetical protein